MPRPDARDYFTEQQPFGPIIADDIPPAIFRDLFDTENLIYPELESRPSLIIGRRGAGKTAFLNSIALSQSTHVIVKLPAHIAFRNIVASIAEFSQDGAVFVEEVADLWKILLWVAIFSQLVREKRERTKLTPVHIYLTALGVRQGTDSYDAMTTALDVIREREQARSASLAPTSVEDLPFNDVSFRQAQEAAYDWLEENQLPVMILLDSLEDFQLDDVKMQHAIAGLLRCQGSFRTPGSPVDIRCCLPAELYHTFVRLSRNPNKDFRNKLLLHWHAEELIRLAARRYARYLELQAPSFYTELKHLKLYQRGDAIAFWNAILPQQVINRLGEREWPLAYILRHTQLLPRHFLMYFNEIAIKNRRISPGARFHLSEEAILEGVLEVEDVICQEIFQAFQYIHPGAREACHSCIKYLPRHFTHGDLQRAYTRHGKGVPQVFDYADFARLMIQIGAVGRVSNETERYVEGVFEYTAPHELRISSEDHLCLHPVFTQAFHAIRPSDSDDRRAIYPYGSDIDATDKRELR
jgi:hypothetical protein